MKLIIDAISNGSGGAKRHLSEILNYCDYNFCKFNSIEVWGPKSLLDHLPNNPKIIKKSHKILNYGLIGFLLFNIFMKRKLYKEKYDIIFSPFGNFTLPLHPYVSMSRNMLMFDENERKRFRLGFQRLKLKFLYLINKKSFENADGLIFLSKHAMNTINLKINIKEVNQELINHGISETFYKKPIKKKFNKNHRIKFLYVSNLLPYKHHINLIDSFTELYNEGLNLSLILIGKNSHKQIGKKVKKIIANNNNPNLIKWHKNIDLNEVKEYYHSSDFFIFSSTCENMPNTLIEAMSSGLPILSSNFPPMPEFLRKGGIYFDPLSKDSIKAAVLKVIKNKSLSFKIANESFELSKQYSWKLCAENTFNYLHKVSKEYQNRD